jgi:Amt family ammonium transporter
MAERTLTATKHSDPLIRPFRWLISPLAPGFLLILVTAPAYAADSSAGDLTEPEMMWIMLALLGFLMPIGVMLVSWGGSDWKRMSSVASTGLLALFLAITGYFASGFALQYGGIGWTHDLGGIEGLSAPFVSTEQVTAGLFGTQGFFLQGEAIGPGVHYLFLSHLPWVMTAVLVPTIALQRHAPGWVRVIIGLLVGALAYPVLANWSWAGGPTSVTAEGGGWLGNLGFNSGLGHGFVAFGGAGTIHLLGGAVALSGILILGRRKSPAKAGGTPTVPLTHLPMLAVLGLLLWAVGWVATLLSHPLYAGGGIPWAAVTLNALAGMAAGATLSQLYAWFTTGQADALMAARGGGAGLVAVMGGAPFLPLWAALLAGGIVGLLVPLLVYLVEEVLRRREPAGALPVSLFGGLVGLLVVGLLASGQSGAGWNNVGAGSYLTVESQGVTGLVAAAGFTADPSQLSAQLLGTGVILGVAGLAGGIVSLLGRLLVRSWETPGKDEEE